MRTCDVEGCTRVHMARGWCSPHYDRWRRHGHPERTSASYSEVWLDARPLLDALEARGLKPRTHLDEADAKAIYRARKSGRVGDVIADRICCRVLGLTLEEVYGWNYEGVA